MTIVHLAGARTRVALAVLAALLAASQPRAQVRYQLTDLGTFGGGSSHANALNDAGQVAGSWTAPGGEQRAFRVERDPNTQAWAMVDPFGGLPGEALGIDALGRVLGRARFPGATPSGEAVTALPPAALQRLFPAGTPSVATAGLADGTVVGYCVEPNALCGALGYLRDPQGQFSYFGMSLGWGQPSAVQLLAVNAKRNAVGELTPPGGLQQAEKTAPPGLYAMPAGYSQSRALAVNDRDLAVGYAIGTQWDRMVPVAFNTALGTTVLPNLPGTQNWGLASGVNLNMQIVGWSTVAPSVTRPFLFFDTRQVDLNDLLTDHAVVVSDAVAINRSGQVAANGTNAHALLLTPTGTIRWSQAGNADVGNPFAWDSGLGFTPSRWLSAVIDPAVDITASVGGDTTVKQLTLGSPLPGKIGRATLSFSGNTTLTALSGTTVYGRATVQGAGRLAGGTTSWGTVQLLPATTLAIDAPFVNHGSILAASLVVAGQPVTLNGLTTSLTNASDGLLKVSSPQAVVLTGAVQANDGTINLVAVAGTPPAVLNVVGRLDNHGLGRVVMLNSTLTTQGGLLNAGTLTATGTGNSVSGAVTNQPGATILVKANSRLVFDGPVANFGVIQREAGATVVFNAGFSGNAPL